MENNEHEEYQKWKNKENGKLGKISRKVHPIWIVVFGLIIFGGNMLVQTKQMSSGAFFSVLIVVTILLAFLFLRESQESKLIPEHIIKQIVYEAMERKRKLGREIPYDATIRVTPLSGASYETDVITGTSGVVKREVGVEIIKRPGLVTKWIVSVHPINGTILDIIPKPLGLNSKDSLGKDKVIIPVQFLDNKSNI